MKKLRSTRARPLGIGRRLFPGLALGLVSCAFPAAGRESDHTFWLTVETDPPGAAIFALGEHGEPAEQCLGQTPCTLAVDIRWDHRWFKPRWELITVLSPGGFCHPLFQEDGTYRLMARLFINKEGWAPVRLETPVAVLPKPDPKSGGKERWPARNTLRLVLEKTAAGPPAPDRREGPRRVILAGGAEGDKMDTGSVTILSRLPKTEVVVDGTSVGPAPLELILRAGPHVLEWSAPGRPPCRREIDLAPDAALKVEATFSP